MGEGRRKEEKDGERQGEGWKKKPISYTSKSRTRDSLVSVLRRRDLENRRSPETKSQCHPLPLNPKGKHTDERGSPHFNDK